MAEDQSGQYLGVQSSGMLQFGIRAAHQPEVEESCQLPGRGAGRFCRVVQEGSTVNRKKVNSLLGVCDSRHVCNIDRDVNPVSGGECRIPGARRRSGGGGQVSLKYKACELLTQEAPFPIGFGFFGIPKLSVLGGNNLMGDPLGSG